MATYLVTRLRDDGSAPEVGGSDRTIISGYKTYRNAFRYAINPFGNGKLVRVEIYPDSIYGNPSEVFKATTYKGNV